MPESGLFSVGNELNIPIVVLNMMKLMVNNIALMMIGKIFIIIVEGMQCHK